MKKIFSFLLIILALAIVLTTMTVFSKFGKKFDSSDPDVTDPDVTDPDVTDPDVTDPDVTDPDLGEPYSSYFFNEEKNTGYIVTDGVCYVFMKGDCPYETSVPIAAIAGVRDNYVRDVRFSSDLTSWILPNESNGEDSGPVLYQISSSVLTTEQFYVTYCIVDVDSNQHAYEVYMDTLGSGSNILTIHVNPSDEIFDSFPW